MQQSVKLKQWLTWWHSLSHSQGSTRRALATVQTLRRGPSSAPGAGIVLMPAGDGLRHSFDFSPLTWTLPTVPCQQHSLRKSFGEKSHGPTQSRTVHVLPACHVFLSLAPKRRKKWMAVHIVTSASHGCSWDHPSYSGGSGPRGPQSCYLTLGA